VATTVWFSLRNPWGIDNIYIAATIPALVMALDYLFFKKNGPTLDAGGLKQ